MKIGFDARMITHPGIGRYIKCLLPELVRLAPQDEFVLFGDPEKLDKIGRSENARVVEWNVPIYSLREQLPFPYGREDMDLLHVPHFNFPAFSRKKMVVTVHDLIYLLFPESVPSPLARYYAHFMVGMALKRASGVIAVSGNTRDDLVKIFGERYSHKIRIIPEAADRCIRRVEIEGDLENIRRRYRLAERIILYVGSVKPHKNIATLIQVHARLKEWGLPHQLVITGRWDNKENHLKGGIDNKDIRYIGEVPAEDLCGLYTMADVLVHLSLYEGFGLTVLEAMQCGTPVVMSDASSLPEVAGNAALAVAPLNIGQIADTVYNVLINKQLRDQMIRAGYERANQFSWEKAARETLDVYRNI